MSRTILTSIVLTFAFLEFGLAQYPFREVGVGPTGTDQIDPSVAVNAYDERIVIASWSDTREPGLHPAQTKLYVASSVDAGATWTNRKLPESQQYTHGANPRVAVGTNIAYVCFTRIGNAGIEDGIFVASSTNLETWTYTQVSPDLGLQYEPTVAVNTISGNTYQDRVYVTWRDWDYARILVRYSDDFGITWSTPYVIAEISNPSADPVRTLPGIEASDSISTETPPDGNMAFHPSIAIGPDGNVYIAWWESVPEKYRLRKSTDGGQSFSPATDIVSAPFVFYRTANDMMIETNRPSFVIAPNGDLLFAFTSPNHVGPFIFYYPRFYRSQNNGASFSESVLPVPSEEVLIYPRISFSESNGVVVTYIYQQVSVIDGMASMWTTASPDNGSTFAPAQRGSAQYSTHADYGYLQYYNGLAVASGSTNLTYHLWTDHGNASADIHTTTLAVVSGDANLDWRMTSVPCIVSDPKRESVWFNANQVFQFSNDVGYVAVGPTEEITRDQGYWAQFPAEANNFNVYLGWPVYYQEMVTRKGWNIVGSISASVPVTNLQPPGLLSPSAGVFKYDNGYVPTSSIDPGFGHWLKVVRNDYLIVEHLFPINEKAGLDSALEMMDKIVISDQSGGRQVLYLTSGNDSIEMPPDPPGSRFNVRFRSDNFVQAVSPEQGIIDASILLKRVTYPVTFSWKARNQNIRIWMKRNQDYLPISGTGSVVFTSRENNLIDLRVQSLGLNKTGNIPTAFGLSEPFPNPFNPQTSLQFDLPASAGASLAIYDILGREVVRLANGVYEAGRHYVSWDASNAASGVYLARFLSTNELGGTLYSQSRKLVLMK